ncbi:DUF4083 domain-containing protein [Gracilibacillus xinjiangensis]|uniref:DUF4083 domain-containing protein n=1 Tax=Gracilibacillus xinjiangensis TaxID=1193282 RepID=A0ABV8WTP7_9BACI
MFLELYASIGGFRIGDMLFALISFIAFLTFIVIFIVALSRKFGRKEQLQRIEDKLDQVIQEKGR